MTKRQIPYYWRKVACPRCGALAGDPCTNLRGVGRYFVEAHTDRKLFAKGERLTGGALLPPEVKGTEVVASPVIVETQETKEDSASPRSVERADSAWLQRVLLDVENDIAQWPEWLRRAAALPERRKPNEIIQTALMSKPQPTPAATPSPETIGKRIADFARNHMGNWALLAEFANAEIASLRSELAVKTEALRSIRRFIVSDDEQPSDIHSLTLKTDGILAIIDEIDTALSSHDKQEKQ